MFTAALLGLAAVATAAPRADLVTTLDAPSGLYVYDTGTYTVTVANTGNRHAADVTVTIDLPETHTSPDVWTMGGIDALDPDCWQDNTQLHCDLGRIRRGTSASVWFDLMLPEAAEVLTVSATASTTTAESDLSDNTDSVSPGLANFDVGFGIPQDVNIVMCTGTDLTSFYECLITGPSSWSTLDLTLEAQGQVTLNQPGFSATWSSLGPEHLAITFWQNGQSVADFEGWGVNDDCWQGITTFPNSSSVSPYQVCTAP